MNPVERKAALRNLNAESVECLFSARITRNAMHEAARRAAQDPRFWRGDIGAGGGFSSISEMILADELNDMLQAARETLQEVSGKVGMP